ncbi:MAG: YggS family pyridoxal phosphate-dependent enzyme [Candidatus Omnitrophota bacterium]
MIRERIRDLRHQIADLASRSGKDPSTIRLVLVTKTVPVEAIRSAYEEGVRDFGENRIQEFLRKKAVLFPDIRWHMVGHLQTNKVKDYLAALKESSQPVLLHSLDRLALAEALESKAVQMGGMRVPCLIQVNTSAETTKGGFSAEEARVFVKRLGEFPHLKVEGFMTIGPWTEDREAIRRSFGGLRELRDKSRELCPDFSGGTLSMGMSGDYEIAIEEGSNMLRIGTLVFGPRSSK